MCSVRLSRFFSIVRCSDHNWNDRPFEDLTGLLFRSPLYKNWDLIYLVLLWILRKRSVVGGSLLSMQELQSIIYIIRQSYNQFFLITAWISMSPYFHMAHTILIVPYYKYGNFNRTRTPCHYLSYNYSWAFVRILSILQHWLYKIY